MAKGLLSSKKANFNFGWLALKLLGKGLYSNYWSAISELVANGFDAQANNVYVYLDTRDKEHTYLEILDDGFGMTQNEIQTYVKVGYNKREELASREDIDPKSIMGRKGIGKLAALFLSDNYHIITKPQTGEASQWRMEFNENPDDSDKPPFLINFEDNVKVACQKTWDSFKSGTLLQLFDVNLVGMGEKAFASLKQKLSNSFSLESMGNRKIYFFNRSYDEEKIEFEEIKKSIAFGNMAYIFTSATNSIELTDKLNSYKNKTLEIPYSKLEGTYKHTIQVTAFGEKKLENPDGLEYSGTLQKGIYKGTEYVLNGWIGIHSTIDKDYATKNDEIYLRNRFYKPTEVRLYVRNKLAMENFLNVVNNTQAFVNYIEGEINFDILDDDEFPDIATSNRQGLDERDDRIELLNEIVTQIVLDLINKRLSLSTEMKNFEAQKIEEKSTESKRVFTEEVNKELRTHTTLPEPELSIISHSITGKIQGDIKIKDKYVVFLSHSSEDKKFSNFVYHLLLDRGAQIHEFFYTSADNNPERINNLDPLKVQIRQNIVDDNSLMVFLATQNYKNSEYCLFEGGAGWATKTAADYVIFSEKFEHIPEYLRSGKVELVLNKEDVTILNRKVYGELVVVMNRIIEHLNYGRSMNNWNLIQPFQKSEIPDSVVLNKENKTIFDYMDSSIVEYWNIYIAEDSKF